MTPPAGAAAFAGVADDWKACIDWDLLVEKIHDGECVPFLGAGASLGFEGRQGLPTAGDIASTIAAYPHVQYPGSDKYDFLRVCQYYELKCRDKGRVRKAVARLVRVPNVEPGVVHESIAELPFNCVLTTNYDDLMERAFDAARRKPTVDLYDLWGDARKLGAPMTIENPLVYKLHGSLERESSMICTEDDVVRFLAALINDNPPLPAQIKEILQKKSFLFIGYGLKDWNIRVILRALRHEKKDAGAAWTRSFAVQRRVDLAADWDASVLYWDRLENVHCLDVDAAEFMKELSRRYRAAYP